MSSINDQGAIFVKAREFIQFIRSTILYTEKLNAFKEFIEPIKDTEDALHHVLVYDFDSHELVHGPTAYIIDIDSNVITLAYVSINSDDKIDVIEKVF